MSQHKSIYLCLNCGHKFSTQDKTISMFHEANVRVCPHCKISNVKKPIVEYVENNNLLYSYSTFISVDKDIADVIFRMYKLGLITHFSCQGSRSGTYSYVCLDYDLIFLNIFTRYSYMVNKKEIYTIESTMIPLDSLGSIGLVMCIYGHYAHCRKFWKDITICLSTYEELKEVTKN